MSQEHDLNEGREDNQDSDDVWASLNADVSAPEGSNHGADPFLQDAAQDPEAAFGSEFDADPDVVDVAATPAKPKKSYTVFAVMGVIALLAIGFAGYIGYSLYSKLFPSDTTIAMGRASSAGLVDTEVSLPGLPAEPAASVSTLPIDAGQELSPGAAQMLVPSSGANGDIAGAVAQDALNPPVVVETPSSPPLQVEAPVAVPPVATPAEVAIAQAPVVPPPEVKKDDPKPVKAVKKAREPRRVAVRHASRPAKETVAKASSPQKQERLLGYSVLAIEPKFGQFQQAWLRDEKGAIHIVKEGDRLGGIVVTSVSFDKGLVQTNAGAIQK